MVKGNEERKKVALKCPDRKKKLQEGNELPCRFPKKDQEQKLPCSMKVVRRDAETESRRLI